VESALGPSCLPMDKDDRIPAFLLEYGHLYPSNSKKVM
jgi:hypothetical protein